MRITPILAAAAFVLLPSAALAAPSVGSLVKLSCPAGAAPDHPCKAVYFYGSDQKRHAFPNEAVYFGWYADFSGVKTVTNAEMAAIPLGRNVTHRPGAALVKFLTDDRVFAVGLGGTLRWVTSESAATALYGANWNKNVHDIPDTFFTDYRFGTDVAQASAYSPAAERAYAASIDDDLPATRRAVTVTTSSGSFAVDVLKLQKDRFTMKSVTGNGSDCSNGCVAKPLKEYAEAAGARIGIHGSYFCPPDYAACADKTYSFLWPVYNATSGTMVNAGSLQFHNGPMITQSADGTYRLLHRAAEYAGWPVSAALSNYPSLIENGMLVVDGEQMLEDGMKTTKATRGGIGYDDRFVYLLVARAATVPDLARVFQALGATHAMNLDGGGSVAMLFDGNYVLGPGRLLPNALVFVPR